MSSDSPAAILFNIDGYELSIHDGYTITSNQSGIISVGKDGSTSRFITVDSSGRQLVVGAGAAGTPSGGIITIQGITGGTDVSVSAASLPLPSGAATEATLSTRLADATFTSRINTLGQKTMANSTPVVLASDQTAISVAQSGSWTVAGTGNFSVVGIGSAGTPTGGVLTIQGASGGQAVPISASSLPLPTGAATESTLSTRLADSTFTSRINTLGQNTMANSTPVVLSSDQTPFFDRSASGTINALNGTVAVSTRGCASCSLVVTGSWSGVLTVEATADGTTWANINAYFVAPVLGLATFTLSSNSTAVAACGGYQQVRLRASSWASGTATVNLNAGAGSGPTAVYSTSASNFQVNIGSWLGSGGPSIGQKTMANSLPVVVASDNTITLTGVVDNAAFTDGTTRVQPSGYIFDEVAGTALTENDAAAARIDSKRAQILVIEDATNRGTRATVKAASTPAAASDPALVVAISPNNTIPISITAGGYGGQIEGRASDGYTPTGNPVFIAGFDGTNVQAILTDTDGRIITTTSNATVATSGFIFGAVPTTGSVQIKVEGTPYTEQISNAQRSIVSSSANDAAAGTGARQIKITYYTSTGVGPNVETITLNGTNPVNTTNTNICYIEKMEVVSVGSNGSNIGTISLKAATGGGGATIGTIGLNTISTGGDNITLWAHHYVPTGKTCFITGILTGHNNNTSIGSGGLFHLKSIPIGVANSVENQISDFIHQFGQDSSTSRIYPTPIQVAGPAKITGYVLPDASLTVNYHLSFDFYEQ